jgi:hypothetical protein
MDSRRRRRVSLDLLRGFRATARHLSFTRAAQECLLVLAISLLAGCASLGMDSTPEPDETTDRSCVRTSSPAAIRLGESAAREDESAAIPPELNQFSSRAIEAARVIDAYPLLLRVAALEARVSSGDARSENELLRVRQRLSERILLTMLQVSSLLAELDCEGERADLLRDRLQKLEERRLRNIAFAGIITGALTAIVSGGLSLASPVTEGGDIAGIAGGTIQAFIGLAGMYGAPAGTLRHERNLLREVWEGPEQSAIFPRPVWRFLTRVRRDSGDPTIRELLIAQWRAGERLGEPVRKPNATGSLSCSETAASTRSTIFERAMRCLTCSRRASRCSIANWNFCSLN